MTVNLREAAEPRDITAMQHLASRLWPRGPHPGGLGWAAAIGQLGGRIVLAEDDRSTAAGDLAEGPGLSGWAAVNQPGELLAQVDRATPDVAATLIEWLLDVAEGPLVTIDVANDDQPLLDAVVGAGFQLSPDCIEDELGRLSGPTIGLRRAVIDAPPQLDNGYRIRNIEPDEDAARVDVHRAAWQPAQLPWHPDHRPAIDPAASSSFFLEHYDRVRRTWLYDPAFDLVVQGADGSLAACCIAWFDPATGWAEIEPLGVTPEHRNRGLAGALCLEVAARVGAAGGREVFINTGPSREYPAPAGAYLKAGFRPFARSRRYQIDR